MHFERFFFYKNAHNIMRSFSSIPLPSGGETSQISRDLWKVVTCQMRLTVTYDWKIHWYCMHFCNTTCKTVTSITCACIIAWKSNFSLKTKLEQFESFMPNWLKGINGFTETKVSEGSGGLSVHRKPQWEHVIFSAWKQ